jgi:hypothetical protein
MKVTEFPSERRAESVKSNSIFTCCVFDFFLFATAITERNDISLKTKQNKLISRCIA